MLGLTGGASMNVSVAEAESKLPELLNVVQGGETVTICREGIPVAEIVRAQPLANRGPRKLGALAGKIVEFDPDWWKAMTDQEADDFIAGKY